MSLSDCVHCWDTPCECGWEYRSWTPERLQKMRDLFIKIIDYKKENPKAEFSAFFSEPETEDDRQLMEYLRGEE